MDIKIGIGTAQFGLNYGISNTVGQTSIDEAKDILSIAHENNLRIIDTAAVYGNSEEVVGNVIQYPNNFRIVTKCPKIGKNQITKDDINDVHNKFHHSLQKLKQKSLYGLLLHCASDLLCDGGELLYKYLCDLKSNGLVNKIGVSIYPLDNIDAIISRYKIDLIQLPLSIFDQRLIRSGHLKKMKEQGIEIHVRSLFLQGLIFIPSSQLSGFFKPIMNKIEYFHSFINDSSITPMIGAYLFGLSIPYIDSFIIGLNTSTQLLENISSYKTAQQMRTVIDFKQFAIDDDEYVNPANWRL